MNRRLGPRAGGAILALLVLVSPVWAEDPLAAVPQPNLELLDAEVARQLRERRTEVERLIESIASGEASSKDLGQALGGLGGLYYLYDYMDLARLCLVEAEKLQPTVARWPYLRGLALKLEGDLEGARDALVRAQSLDGADPTVLIRLGDVWFDFGELDRADANYRKALELAPDRPAAHYGLGRIASARGDYPGAIESLERTVALQPAATSVHHQIGMAYREQGDLEAARRHLGKNTGGRVQVVDPVVESLGSELQTTNQAFAAGIRALRAGHLDQAIALFLVAREQRPEDHLAEYNLALAYLKNGKADNAARAHKANTRELGIEALRRSIEKKPDFRNGHFNLGSLLAEAGEYRQAEVHFGRAHEIDSEDDDAHLEWATALSLTDQSQRAIAEFKSLLARAPHLTVGWVRLGTLQLNAGAAQPAAASFGRVLAGDASPEERAEAHLGLGRVSERSGDWDAAVECFEAAAQLAVGSEARLALATALGRVGRFGEAARAFSLVVESKPEALEPHFGRAMALLLGESYSAARDALESSLTRHADSLPLRHLYSRLLATAPDAAVRDGGRALEIANEVFRASQTLDHAETVSMALAETGRFDEALDWQRRVVAEAERAGNRVAAGAAERRLRQYERQEPCRAPWLGG